MIKKADMPDQGDYLIQTPAGETGSLDLTTMLAEGGQITLSVVGGNQLEGSPVIDGNVLSWKVREDANDIAVTITVSIKDADYYNDYDIMISIIGHSPSIVTLPVTQADGVYGTPLPDPVFEKPEADGTVSLTYSGTVLADGSIYDYSDIAPKLPGSYTVNVTYKTPGTLYSGNADFAIKKADWTDTTVNTTATAGKDGRVDLARRMPENAKLGSISVIEGRSYLAKDPSIAGASVLEWEIIETSESINVVLSIPVTGADNYNDYEIIVNLVGQTSAPVEEAITLNGIKVSSLKEAFSQMKDPNTDYVISMGIDVKEDKDLTIPKTARSVTINGNGHTLELKGSKLTANAPLSISRINITAFKKNGDPSKFTLFAKKDLQIGRNTVINSAAATVKSTGTFALSGSFSAKTITAKNFTLEGGSVLTLPSDGSLTISGALKGNGGSIKLPNGFYKPIKLTGTVDGTVFFTGAKQSDGTQILKCSSKNIGIYALKKCFDVSDIAENDINTYLYYSASGKAAIFGESISYNGAKYGVWKDAVSVMNADLKAARSAKREIAFEIELLGNVNVCGSFKLPSKGYTGITLKGNEHTMTFTGDIKLSGNTVFEDVTLNKVDKKGNKKSGKVIKGKYSYEGPEIF